MMPIIHSLMANEKYTTENEKQKKEKENSTAAEFK